MSEIQAIASVVSALVVPFLVQAIKTEAMGGEVARWVSIMVSLLAGLLTGLAGGVPDDPGAWATCVFAVVGGVQVAYSAFKSVGVTSKWLDALLSLGSSDPKHEAR